MKHKNRGVVVLTKWMFETYADPDTPGIISTGDVAGEESGDDLDLFVDPDMETINDSDFDSLDWLSDRDRVADETDSFGGWIAETQKGIRTELRLAEPDVPSIGRFARSHRLHKVQPLIWF
jgi:hypothetical protein